MVMLVYDHLLTFDDEVRLNQGIRVIAVDVVLTVWQVEYIWKRSKGIGVCYDVHVHACVYAYAD
jgi:hypothetical protein